MKILFQSKFFHHVQSTRGPLKLKSQPRRLLARLLNLGRRARRLGQEILRRLIKTVTGSLGDLQHPEDPKVWWLGLNPSVRAKGLYSALNNRRPIAKILARCFSRTT